MVPLRSHRGDARRCGEAWAAGSGLQPPAGAAPWHSPDYSPPAPAHTHGHPSQVFSCLNKSHRREHVGPPQLSPATGDADFCQFFECVYSWQYCPTGQKAALTGSSCRSSHPFLEQLCISASSACQSHDIHV